LRAGSGRAYAAGPRADQPPHRCRGPVDHPADPSDPPRGHSLTMQKLRNLRLAVRLGIAFGALALGVAIVATVAFISADSTQSSIESLVHRSVRSTAIVSDMETRSHDIAHGVSQHLYVYDGDITQEDEVQKDIVSLRDANTKDFAELTKLAQNTPAADELAAYSTARDGFRAAYLKAVELSRKETLAGVENRDGSRTVYLEQVVPRLEKLEGASEELTGDLDRQLDSAAAHTVSSAGAAKRNVLIVGLLALAAALALAIWITRSVTRPVHALSTRLQSLNDHCLVALSHGIESVADGDLTQEVRRPPSRRRSTSSPPTRSACSRARSTRCWARRSARSRPTTPCGRA
jgi:nitrogen fixation/metabolism regulation signal transduction histidine kinase